MPQTFVLLFLRTKPQFLSGQQSELLGKSLLGPHKTSSLAPVQDLACLEGTR